jgi:hypothetical protein
MKLDFTFEKDKGWYIVRNNKKDVLGIIFFWKKWKCWVWEQQESIIMSDDCLEQVINKLKELNKK